MGAFNEFQNGFREGRAGKYTALAVIILIVVALYFIQKWTGIPVLDWVKQAGEWIISNLLHLISIILNKIV